MKEFPERRALLGSTTRKMSDSGLTRHKPICRSTMQKVRAATSLAWLRLSDGRNLPMKLKLRDLLGSAMILAFLMPTPVPLAAQSVEPIRLHPQNPRFTPEGLIPESLSDARRFAGVSFGRWYFASYRVFSISHCSLWYALVYARICWRSRSPS